MALVNDALPPRATAHGRSSERRQTLAFARVATGPVLLVAAVLGHLIAFLFVFPALMEDVILRGSLHLFYLDSGRLLSGSVPYRDFLFEYPPGSLAIIALPRLFAVGFLSFRVMFFVEIALLDVVMLAVLYATARTVRASPLAALGLYSVMIAALGPLVLYRLDLAPAVVTAFAVLVWLRGRFLLAAAALAVGVAIKAYPLILLPPLLIDAWITVGPRRAAYVCPVFGAALVAGLSPLLLAGRRGIQSLLSFQLDRHLQVESIWATMPLVLHRLTGFPLEVSGRERAEVVLGPGGGAGQPGTLVLVGVAAFVYLRWLWVRYRREGDAAALLAVVATLLVAATALSKVLSPQYFLWSIPAIVLLPVRTRRMVVVLVFVVVALMCTQWIYPLHYGELVRFVEPGIIAVLALRNLLVLTTLLLLLTMPWAVHRLKS